MKPHKKMTVFDNIFYLSNLFPDQVKIGASNPKLFTRFKQHFSVVFLSIKKIDIDFDRFWSQINGLKLFDLYFYPYNTMGNKNLVSLKDFVPNFRLSITSKINIPAYFRPIAQAQEKLITIGYLDDLENSSGNYFIALMEGFPEITKSEIISSSLSSFLDIYLEYKKEYNYSQNTVLPPLDYFIQRDKELRKKSEDGTLELYKSKRFIVFDF